MDKTRLAAGRDRSMALSHEFAALSEPSSGSPLRFATLPRCDFHVKVSPQRRAGW